MNLSFVVLCLMVLFVEIHAKNAILFTTETTSLSSTLSTTLSSTLTTTETATRLTTTTNIQTTTSQEDVFLYIYQKKKALSFMDIIIISIIFTVVLLNIIFIVWICKQQVVKKVVSEENITPPVIYV